jgi:pimeloyl-ACP methyl ester carboxylesterase
MSFMIRITTFSVSFLLPFVIAAEQGSSQVASKSHTVTVNGIEMYYEVLGEGEPLVLLHSGTQSARMFDPFVEELSARYRLIIPDLRGHGGSTNPDKLWTMRQFAEDVFALLDHLGIERFKAIGASAGGMTLLHMATGQPERIEVMIVVGVGTYLPAECRETLAKTKIDDTPEDAWAVLRERHKHGDEQIRALYAWIASLAESYNDMTFTPPYLSTITARTLVVHGDRDYCFPASMAWDIYSAIPRAYLWVVPNGDHVPISGPHAEPFARTAMEFLGGSWER